MKKIILLLLILVVGICAGCTSKHMAPAQDPSILPSIASDKATIVFMRPSTFGMGVQSTVHEIVNDNPEFVAILSSKMKVAYEVTPGRKVFMVVGESADFMEANVAPGKVYYVLVEPRMGLIKARFKFNPMSRQELETSDFAKWNDKCKFYKNTPASRKWAVDHRSSTVNRYTGNYSEWKAKDVKDKAVLGLQDFMPEDRVISAE